MLCYFQKDALGNVQYIKNSAGKIVATYTYDAYGNSTVTNASGYTIGNMNPFRYRGYYCDTETGFYYLQSRYYDPSIMRFINADDYELISTLASTIGQLNLYAYCNDNPIMYTDESGTLIWELVVTGLIVVTLAALDGGISAQLSGGSFGKGFAAGAIGGFVGYVISIIPGLGLIAGSLLGRIASTGIYDLLNPLFQNGKISGSDMRILLADIALDFITSCLYYAPTSWQKSTGLRKILLSSISASIDGVIDIAQTPFYSKEFNSSSEPQVANNVTDLYIVG